MTPALEKGPINSLPRRPPAAGAWLSVIAAAAEEVVVREDEKPPNLHATSESKGFARLLKATRLPLADGSSGKDVSLRGAGGLLT